MGFFNRKRKGSELEAVANAPVGASVQLQGRSGTISGTLVFSSAGDHWVEHLITQEDGQRIWVSIENFDTTVGTRWDVASVSRVRGGPNDTRVSYDAVNYNRSEAGSASFVSKGDTGCDENGTVDFVDFAAPDGSRLGFERYGEVGARRRSIATVGVCPNCGAPLTVDVHGRCSHCNAAAGVDEGTWGEWEVSTGTDISDQISLR